MVPNISESALKLTQHLLKASAGDTDQMFHDLVGLLLRGNSAPTCSLRNRLCKADDRLTTEFSHGANRFIQIANLNISKEVNQRLQVATVSRLQGIKVAFPVVFIPNHKNEGQSAFRKIAAVRARATRPFPS